MREERAHAIIDNATKALDDSLHMIRDLRARGDRLRAALVEARDALHNDFEPDNQSRSWYRANDALKQDQ